MLEHIINNILIWGIPTALSLFVSIWVQKFAGSGWTKRPRVSLRDFHLFLSFILPLLILVSGQPLMLAFPGPPKQGSQESGSDPVSFAGRSLAANLILAVLFTLLLKATTVFHLDSGPVELLYYWWRAGMFFNLIMISLHLLPWPPFFLGCIIFGNRLQHLTYTRGILLAAFLIIVIPADNGFGKIIYPLYSFLANWAG